ncbi:MAG: response regulator [Spirochaeta sp.]|jgi:putative two-component system response regulator|nr:response regulator [Spirochaeta sp.]
MDTATVLIVDDEPANLSVVSDILRPSYNVRVARTGEQALKIARQDPRPDLILLDVMMPEMDGYAVLRRLREDGDLPMIPVIFVTALSDGVDEEYGLSLGAEDYITKPAKPAILIARVRTHLEIKYARDRLRDQNGWLEAEVARQMRENKMLLQVTLNVILGLAESRDSDTGNHIARTQAYVQALGRQLQLHSTYAEPLRDDQLHLIVKAAPLHDIGKIGIPDHILLKPGKLDAEEWEIMKTHTTIGADAIERALRMALSQEGITSGGPGPGLTPSAGSTLDSRGSVPVLEMAQEIAARHHEKWDGTGYPNSLAGEEIPVAARLMALADVYDALTMSRVYKKAWSFENTEELILSERGRHFCPVVVDAFSTITEQFRDIHRRLGDETFEDATI